MTRPKSENTNTKNMILDAAVELFIHEGFETTSMDAIAAAAGTAKGTLYYHYGSKEGIVGAIIERYIVSVENLFAGIEADSKTGPLEKLGGLNSALKKISSETFSKLHYMKYIDIHEKIRRSMVERLSPWYARVFEQGKKEGVWSVTKPLAYAEILIIIGSFLFDPENATSRSDERLHVFMDLCARILGISIKQIASAFSSFGKSADQGDTYEHT